MFSALISFLGGAAFRYALGRAVDWLEKRQEFMQEQKRLEQQERFSALAHTRNLESIKLQHELGVQQIQIKGDADAMLEAARAFTEAQKRAFTPTGIAWIDAWNGSIRPATASIALALWMLQVVRRGFELVQFDLDLISSVLGFFFADRHLGKRGAGK